MMSPHWAEGHLSSLIHHPTFFHLAWLLFFLSCFNFYYIFFLHHTFDLGCVFQCYPKILRIQEDKLKCIITISKQVGDSKKAMKEDVSLGYLLYCLWSTHSSILKSCLWVTLIFSDAVSLSPRSHACFASWFNDAGESSVESDTVPSCWWPRGHQKYRWQRAINTSPLCSDGGQVSKTAVLSPEGAYIFSKHLSFKESILNGVEALSF